MLVVWLEDGAFVDVVVLVEGVVVMLENIVYEVIWCMLWVLVLVAEVLCDGVLQFGLVLYGVFVGIVRVVVLVQEDDILLVESCGVVSQELIC